MTLSLSPVLSEIFRARQGRPQMGYAHTCGISSSKLHGYGYSIVPDTGIGILYIIFLKTYVKHNGYWISGMIRVQVSGTIRVRVHGLKWSTRAT